MGTNEKILKIISDLKKEARFDADTEKELYKLAESQSDPLTKFDCCNKALYYGLLSLEKEKLAKKIEKANEL